MLDLGLGSVSHDVVIGSGGVEIGGRIKTRSPRKGKWVVPLNPFSFPDPRKK